MRPMRLKWPSPANEADEAHGAGLMRPLSLIRPSGLMRLTRIALIF
jgi:hypothetical protein